MNLIVSANTSLDRILVVPGFQVNRVHRVQSEHAIAGGKALNVLRALRTWGDRQSAAVVAVGGLAGAVARKLLEQEGLDAACSVVEIQGATRQCDIVVDSQAMTSTVVNGLGPALSPEEVSALTKAVNHGLARQHFDYLVLTGSLPPNTPVGWYAGLIEAARARGTDAVLDAAGEVLYYGALARPWMVKVNRAEFWGLVEAWARGGDGAADQGERIDRVARALVERGTAWVIVTNGAEPTLVWGREGRWQVSVPPLAAAVNPIASGDAFLAGMLAGYQRFGRLEQALKWATAAAQSNAANLLPQVAETVELDRWAASVGITFHPVQRTGGDR